MRSQLEFFMAPNDTDDFVQTAMRLGLSKEDQFLVSNTIPAGYIQYLPCRQFGPELISGRIAIATPPSESDTQAKASGSEALVVYNALRRHLRKTYCNKLVAYTDGIKSVRVCRSLWLGPHALAWHRTTKGAVLRQGVGYRSNFVPEAQATEGDA